MGPGPGGLHRRRRWCLLGATSSLVQPRRGGGRADHRLIEHFKETDPNDEWESRAYRVTPAEIAAHQQLAGWFRRPSCTVMPVRSSSGRRGPAAAMCRSFHGRRCRRERGTRPGPGWPAVPAWPRHSRAPLARYLPLGEALWRHWPYDAHTAQYSAPAKPQSPRRRCARRAGRHLDGARNLRRRRPGTHRDRRVRRGELAKVNALRRAMPGLVVYFTRGGYRIVGVLPAPIIIASPADADAWKRRYRAWLGHLDRSFGIIADANCQPWTCLFRLPHATREVRS